MTLENVLLYIPAAVLIVLMPGPDFAVITKTALVRGRTAGVICSAGVACGLLVHTTLAALGISALVAHSVTLFTVLKWVGAAYRLPVKTLISSPHAAGDSRKAGFRGFSVMS